MSSSLQRVLVPGDSAARSVGADDVAARLADALPTDTPVIRNGSRGLFWLEPLIEVERNGERLGFGPVTVEDVDDIIEAGGGDDTILAGDGDDEVFAGEGDDEVHGGPGNDTIFGEDGMDTIAGGAGDDSVDGGDDARTDAGWVERRVGFGELGAEQVRCRVECIHLQWRHQ